MTGNPNQSTETTINAFKAYDIRGEFGVELTGEMAFDVGRALVEELDAHRIVVGRDMRPHGVELAEQLIAGILHAGATPIDLGLVSTPMCYFANVELRADAGVMVTASHNPPQDNGLKVSRADALPMGYESGLKEIEQRLLNRNWRAAPQPGERETHDIHPAYRDAMRRHVTFTSKPRVVLDFANAMGSVEMHGLLDLFDATLLYEPLDGTFPNHLANPLQTETLDDLRRVVRETGAHFGAAFDGDADRLGFVDEKGNLIRLDLVTAILAAEYLREEPGATIVHDVRTGKAVRQYIRDHGGQPVEWRVGHAYMKRKMRELNAPFGGELAGHYYFRELSTSESTALMLIKIANILDREQLTMSELFAPLQRYANSGEINLRLPDRAAMPNILERLRSTFADGELSELDGLRGDFGTWWFNARPSNTEPWLRLIIEADTHDLLERKRHELLTLIEAQS